MLDVSILWTTGQNCFCLWIKILSRVLISKSPILQDRQFQVTLFIFLSGDLNGRTTHHNSLPRPNQMITNPNPTTEVQCHREPTLSLTVGYPDRYVSCSDKYQAHPPLITYNCFNRTSGSGTSVNAGVMPGHVQQMVRRMSPAGPPPQQPDGVGFYQPYNLRQVSNTRQQPVVSQMSSSSVMRENHKPIIKGI